MTLTSFHKLNTWVCLKVRPFCYYIPYFHFSIISRHCCPPLLVHCVCKNIVIGFLFDPLRHHRHLVILEVMVCVVSVSAPATLQSLHYRSQELLFLPASAKICWSRYQRHKRPAMPYLNAFFFLNILAWFTPFFFSLSQVFKCFEVCLTDCCNDFWEDRMRLARV